VQRQRYTVPFGRTEVEFALPPSMRGSSIGAEPIAPFPDPAAAAERALAEPLGARSLRDLALGKKRVCIAVTDATRACPDHVLVPPMLSALADAGVPDEAITILVAVGAHRASTVAEKEEKLGAAVVSRYRVVDHDGTDDANLVAVMTGPGGIPFRVNRLAVEADLLLSTGVVEPHQYAGYSGGGKTVAIGCSDEATISYTHGPAMLDLPGTRLAQLGGNPFQDTVRAVARAAALAYVANAVLDEEGRMVAVAYGAPEAVQDHLASLAGPMFTVDIPRQVDIAVAGVGYPKDVNLYQASRAASYLQFAPTPVVRRGGVIVIPAACPEGAGEGAGEQRFLAAMSGPGGPTAVITRARRLGIRPGEQRAYVMSLVLEDVDVIVAGIADPEIARLVGFIPADSIGDALRIAAGRTGEHAEVLVVPHALQTLPIVRNGAKPA
jgi:nickel-dependent lactate racemase